MRYAEPFPLCNSPFGTWSPVSLHTVQFVNHRYRTVHFLPFTPILLLERESCQTTMMLLTVDPVTAWHAATLCCHTTERQNCSEMQCIILYSRYFGLAFVHQVISFELGCFGSYLAPNITTFVGLINPELCMGILRVGWM